jgi:hypothetical protein
MVPGSEFRVPGSGVGVVVPECGTRNPEPGTLSDGIQQCRTRPPILGAL